MEVADAELVQRTRSGDIGAFEELYRRHVGRIYGLCLRMAADAVLAEELTQEVFVRTWERLHSFRGESAFTSWLHRLAVNVVLGERRARSRRNARFVAVEDPEKHGASNPAVNPGACIDLEEAIARLPEGARTIFVLHDIEGYRHHEIAAMTGVATGTSKAQLHRARCLLREVLA